MLGSVIWWGMLLCLWIIFVFFIKDDGRMKNNQRRINILHGVTGITGKIAILNIFHSNFLRSQFTLCQFTLCLGLMMSYSHFFQLFVWSCISSLFGAIHQLNDPSTRRDWMWRTQWHQLQIENFISSHFKLPLEF